MAPTTLSPLLPLPRFSFSLPLFSRPPPPNPSLFFSLPLPSYPLLTVSIYLKCYCMTECHSCSQYVPLLQLLCTILYIYTRNHSTWYNIIAVYSTEILNTSLHNTAMSDHHATASAQAFSMAVNREK